MNGDLLELIEQAGVNGLVIEGFGAGNLPPAVLPALKQLIADQVPVALVSRSVNGSVAPIYAYEGGAKQLQALGVILSHNLNGQKALIRMQIGLSAGMSGTTLANYLKKMRAIKMTEIKRPTWAISNPLMQQYYDTQWGIELHDERALFEMLCLETYQAGLSWQTVLNKRSAFEDAFHHYEIEQVAQMTETQIAPQLKNEKIIRNRLKLNATVNNARTIVKLHVAGRTFDDYIWQFVDYQPQRLVIQKDENLPAQTRLSVQVSKQMKKKMVLSLLGQ